MMHASDECQHEELSITRVTGHIKIRGLTLCMEDTFCMADTFWTL